MISSLSGRFSAVGISLPRRLELARLESKLQSSRSPSRLVLLILRLELAAVPAAY